MTTQSLATTVADWAIGLMETLGAPGAGVAIALENLFPPLPSEVILPLAGFTAAQGSLVLWHVLVWTTAGSVVGALLLYGLGAWLGRVRLRNIVDRMPLVKLEDVDKAEAWFTRYGSWAVLIGRLIPIVRSLISIPAGVERMPLGRFLAFTTLGSAVWNTLLVGAGYLLGEQWHIVEQSVGVFQRVVIVALAILVVWWLVRALLGRQVQDTPRHVRKR
jgi:membrane protein DedA with SNARE-associated domain